MRRAQQRRVDHTFQQFTFKRIWKGTIGITLLYGIYTLSQSVGLVTAYPNVIERAKLILALKSSTGLDVMYGSGARLDGGINSYMEWRVLGFGVIFAALWALVVATKLFRQDDENGRSEHILGRLTTQLRSFSLTTRVILFALLLQLATATGIMLLANKANGVSFSPGSSLLFMTAMVSGALLFATVGMFTAQLFETRKRAMLWAGVVLVVSFGLRALVSINKDFRWVRFVSPLNWIEEIHPLTAQNYVWFAPIVITSLVLVGISAYLNKKRDMGAGIVTPKDTVKHRSHLLGSTLSSSFLFMRGSLAVWAVAIIGFTTFLASLSRTVIKALQDSGGGFKDKVGTVLHGQNTAAVTIFVSMAFFIATILILVAVTGFVGAIRNEESSGTLENIVVNPRSRLRWLSERMSIIVLGIFCIAVLSSICAWAMLPADSGVKFLTMFEAGINGLFPAVLIMGVGILTFALKPRLTTVLGYAIIIWSILGQIIISIVAPNSAWLRTSLFYFIPSVPAANMQWTTSLVMLGLGVTFCVIGSIIFNRRDLQGE